MKKVLYLPLDERPCNYSYPSFLAGLTDDYEFIVPTEDILGYKKKAADTNALWKWLETNCAGANGLIVSIDMLVYGGIVPSRLHSMSLSECIEKLEKLRELKNCKPELKIYAFNLIMRCPKYSSSDEEPDYYEKYGEQIFKRKYIEHKAFLNLTSENEKELFKGLTVPKEILSDFENRRALNLKVNMHSIKMMKDKVFEFLVIPQDDSAPYGYTAIDQQKVRSEIKRLEMETKIPMYPGADEVGCTLFARFFNQDRKLKPRIYIRYPGAKAPFVIPLYEDRIIHETVKCHITSCGGMITDNPSESDIVLLVNAPGSDMKEARDQAKPSLGYDVERNIVEFAGFAEDCVTKGKNVAIADSAYGNGGDIELFRILKEKNLLFKLASYAGWNTNGNTLGTAISHAMISSVCKITQKHLNYLAHRYIEDIGYCSMVRWDVTDNHLSSLGLNYFQVDGKRGKIAQLVKEKLSAFTDENLNSLNLEFSITDCFMPWERMFEVGIMLEGVSK